MMSKIRILILLVIFASFFAESSGQINGASNVISYSVSNQVSVYSVDLGRSLSKAKWTVSNGIADLQFMPVAGTTEYKLGVKWNDPTTSPGPGSVMFHYEDGSGDHDMTLNVSVYAVPPVPNTTFSISYYCGYSIITRNSSPPSGVQWQWENVSNGVSTVLGNGPSLSASTGGTYYLRAYYNVYPGAWSTSSVSTGNIVVHEAIDAPVNGSSNFAFSGTNVSLSVSAVAEATYYKWYNSAGAVQQVTPTNVFPFVTTQSTTLYVAAGIDYCESLSRTPVVITVEPQPTIRTTNNESPTITLRKAIDLITNSPYGTYQWRDAGGNAIGSEAKMNITTPGSYSVYVTKSGYQGFGLSAPFVVYGGQDGQNLNYITTNIPVVPISDVAALKNQNVGTLFQTTDYFDGLGRKIQTVGTQASPKGNDIVQPSIYDPYGRESRKYLPVTPKASDGWYKSDMLNEQGEYVGPVEDFYDNGDDDNIADDSSPYAETVYEPSSLNRVMKQGFSGQVWKPNSDPKDLADKTIKIRYETNDDDKVLHFEFDQASNALVLETGEARFYDKYELMAKRTYDERNFQTIEYVDKEGKMVCKKVQYGSAVSGDLFACTYYVYDDFGQLIVVLPPEAIVEITDRLN